MNGSGTRLLRRGYRALFVALAIFFTLLPPAARAEAPTAAQAEMEEAAARQGWEANVPHTWETRRTRYFRIHSDPVDRANAEFLAEEIDAWMDEAAARVGHPIEGTVDLLLAPTYEAFMAVQPGDAPSWAVGTAYSKLGLITVRSPRATPSQTDYSLRQTTVHEIAHIVLGWAFGDQRIPRWLHEGLAKYVAGETTWETRITLSGAVLTGSLIPLDELARDFPRSTARATLAYAESLEFLSYLIDEFGGAVIPNLVNELADGHPFDEAIATVTGVSFADLEQGWHKHLRLNFAWLPALTTGGGLWVFASALVFVGWARKKWESRQRRSRWEVEEAILYGTNLALSSTEPASGALGRPAWPRHLQVIDGGRQDAPPAEAQEPDLDDDVEVPRFRGYVDDLDDDDERPPPGGWLH